MQYDNGGVVSTNQAKADVLTLGTFFSNVFTPEYSGCYLRFLATLMDGRKEEATLEDVDISSQVVEEKLTASCRSQPVCRPNP